MTNNGNNHTNATTPNVPGMAKRDTSTSAKDNGAESPKPSGTQPDKTTQAVAPQKTKAPAKPVVSTSQETEKPKDWKASLSLAQFKAIEAEEALRKHNERFPPKAATASKKAQNAGKFNNAKPVAPAKMSDRTKPISMGGNAKPMTAAGNSNDIKPTAPASNGGEATPDEGFTTVGRKAKVKQPADLKFQRPQPPCGLPGCKVLGPHERRPYRFDEPNRPN